MESCGFGDKIGDIIRRYQAWFLRCKSSLCLNWLTEEDSITLACSSFQIGTMRLMKKRFLAPCLDSRRLCPLIPLAGPDWLIELGRGFGLSQFMNLISLYILKYWIRSSRVRLSFSVDKSNTDMFNFWFSGPILWFFFGLPRCRSRFFSKFCWNL